MRRGDVNRAFERAKILTAMFLLLACPFADGASAQEYEMGSSYVLVEILPEDAAALVKRADGCVHWQGEADFDEERKKQIQDARDSLKCSDLRDDYGILSAKYKDDVTAIKALGYIEKYYLR